MFLMRLLSESATKSVKDDVLMLMLLDRAMPMGWEKIALLEYPLAKLLLFI